mgnify:CR=1 FL=1
MTLPAIKIQRIFRENYEKKIIKLRKAKNNKLRKN